MHLRCQLLETFRRLLRGDPGIVVIHSSIANLGPPQSFDKWDIVYALSGLVKAGWTVALPAFTFCFCGKGSYHYRKSRSEVGILADWFLVDAGGASRTPHPIYSFVVAGPAADRIAACPSLTTFGDDSPFGLFERENATIMMLGCGWKYATQFHRYEEKARVPYRYFKDFVGQADLGDGKGCRRVSAQMYVRDLELNPSNDFTPAVKSLQAEGLIQTESLWRGLIAATRAADLARISTRMLAVDPMAFVASGPQLAFRLAGRTRAAAQPPLRVAVLGSMNVERLRTAFNNELSVLLADRRVQTFEVPYGQLHQQLLNPASELRAWRPDVSIFCDRLEDVIGVTRLETTDGERSDEMVDRYVDAIADWSMANGGWTLVNTFALLYPTVEATEMQATALLVARMNKRCSQRLSCLGQLSMVDIAAESGVAGTPAIDFRLWHLGRIPYSEPFSRRLARRWASKVLSMIGRSARVIVLDLDNTLWGGVLGEEGLRGVQLGGDFPGNAFLSFQRSLRILKERGIGLAICSKNDEKMAIDAIDHLPDMQIRSADLVAHRINWRPKHENIREIASELNLGLESLLFIDDNPLERELVRLNTPEVRILELSADPTSFIEALTDSPWLDVANVTEEDRKRESGYQKRRVVEQRRAAAENLDAFYADLRMKLRLQPLSEENAARAAQLCMKTNQFNATTRRYDQRDLWRIVEGSDEVIVIGLEDRFSGMENIGILILRTDEARNGFVDNYLLSCRVLGRGLEIVVLHWALRHVAARGWKTLQGKIIETDRNTPVRGVYRDSGFQAGTKPGDWIAIPADASDLPVWLTILDQTSAESLSLRG